MMFTLPESANRVVLHRMITVLLSSAFFATACSSTENSSELSALEDRLATVESLVEDLSNKIEALEVPFDTDTEETFSEAEESTPSSEPIDSGEGSRSNPIPLGTAAKVGEGWTLRINGVEFDARDYEAWNSFNDPPPDGYAYVVINITTGYTGPETKSSDGVIISAVGDSNVEISNDLFVVPPDPQYEPYIDVFAGGENSGNIVLAVRLDDLDSIVLYAEALMSFDSSEVFFALR